MNVFVKVRENRSQKFLRPNNIDNVGISPLSMFRESFVRGYCSFHWFRLYQLLLYIVVSSLTIHRSLLHSVDSKKNVFNFTCQRFLVNCLLNGINVVIAHRYFFQIIIVQKVTKLRLLRSL